MTPTLFLLFRLFTTSFLQQVFAFLPKTSQRWRPVFFVLVVFGRFPPTSVYALLSLASLCHPLGAVVTNDLLINERDLHINVLLNPTTHLVWVT
jgi:hypothetical protein